MYTIIKYNQLFIGKGYHKENTEWAITVLFLSAQNGSAYCPTLSGPLLQNIS